MLTVLFQGSEIIRDCYSFLLNTNLSIIKYNYIDSNMEMISKNYSLVPPP